MAEFTTEAAVRLKFQVPDSAATDALVAASIDAAHAELMGRLGPAVDTASPAECLVLGETLLAGARLLASLASGEAVSARPLSIGGQRIEAGQRFASLRAMAARAECEAWRALAPYLAARPGTQVGGATDTRPVLGA